MHGRTEGVELIQELSLGRDPKAVCRWVVPVFGCVGAKTVMGRSVVSEASRKAGSQEQRAPVLHYVLDLQLSNSVRLTDAGR